MLSHFALAMCQDTISSKIECTKLPLALDSVVLVCSQKKEKMGIELRCLSVIRKQAYQLTLGINMQLTKVPCSSENMASRAYRLKSCWTFFCGPKASGPPFKGTGMLLAYPRPSVKHALQRRHFLSLVKLTSLSHA